MPFRSAKQRRFLHKFHPDVAKRWEKEEKSGDYNPRREAIKKRLANRRKNT